ncbi:hypothetical protein HQ489_05590 [Candidatus Woesearchaeota archaeon]|nr:hypothetical protein [Candidatus Woesearchaeota archaeon]
MVNFNIESLVQNTTVGFGQIEKAFLSYHGHEDGTKAAIAHTEAPSPLEDALYAPKTEHRAVDIQCCCGQRFEVAPNGQMVEFNEIADKQSMLVLGDKEKQDPKYNISHDSQKGMYSVPSGIYSNTVSY